jgi:catechol 2,3-dioxygenase-like lactoylglutathione lyase family enzyme
MSRAHSAISKIDKVGISVADQGRAADFYVNTLGLEKRIDVSSPEGRWLEVAPRGAGTTIALIARGSGPPAAAGETGLRFATDDASAEHDRLVALGVEADDVLRLGPEIPTMFTLRDPDDNNLVIVERTDR